MRKTRKKQIMDFIFGFVVFYAAICAFLYFNQRNLMYFPAGPREPIEMLVETLPETVTVTPDTGIELQGFYWPAQPGFPTLVFFHGNGQAYQYWMNKLTIFRNHGYGAYFTDYRGYGGQPGTPTEQGLYNDARAFIAAIQERGVQPGEMILYGESLGTGIAVQVAQEMTAAQNPPQAMILESAYSATSEVAKSRYWMFPVDWLMKDQYRSIDKIAALTMPKFFIHAQNDSIIPVRFAKALYDAAPQPKALYLIPNGGHNDLYDHGAALQILEFLSTLSLKHKKNG